MRTFTARIRTGIRYSPAAALVVFGLLITPQSSSAQPELPTADELEAGESDASESQDSRESPETSESSDDSEADSSDDSSDSSQTSKQETTEASTSSEETESMKLMDAEETSSTSESSASEETSDSTETSEDKRGEIIEQTETVEREMEGPHSDASEINRVQEGVNIRGVPGFQRITSARPRKPMTFRFSLGSDFTAGTNVIRRSDDNRFFGGRLNLQGTFLKYISANLGFRARNNVNNYGRPRAMLALGDLDLGLRGHYAPLEGLDLGLGLNLDIPSGFQSAGPDFSGTSIRPQLLGTVDIGVLADRDIPLDAHLNVGYRADNSANLVPRGVRLTRVERFAHDISAYDYLEIGIGTQYDLPYVSPFLSWNLDIPVAGQDGVCEPARPLPCAEQVGFQSYPHTLSLGLQAEPIEQLALQAAVDMGLTPDQAEGVPTTPPYAITLGASWTIDLDPRVERVTRRIETTRAITPERGRIVGRVLDAETGDPIEGARIRYTGGDGDGMRTPQMTDGSEGTFTSYGFEPETEVEFEVTHPDFKSKTITRTISKGKQELEIKLDPKPRMATIKGTVVDTEGSPVSGATVSFDGPQRATAQTDGSGAFSRELEPGTYTIAVSADTYMTGGRDISLGERAQEQIRISLKSAPDEDLATLEGENITVEERVQFETGSADLADESRAILDQVTAILLEHPELSRVEVQGHTDNRGASSKNLELSQKRAETVKQYLVDQGISADRLTAEGYGSKQPRVPNISARNRRLNRRVEFKVLQK